MSKRKRSTSQLIHEIRTAKKRKIEEAKEDQPPHLNELIKEYITALTSKFINKYTSNNLSLVINDYRSLNETEKDYPFIYLSSQNKWKHHNKLKKSEKIQYLNEQIIHPLQYLIAQFSLKQINKSLHFDYFMKGKSTSKTKWSKRHKFWITSDVPKCIKPNYWKNDDDTFISRTIDCVCHFIQKESGTGVHIGNGYILSCSHVIVSDTDNQDEDIDRIGRIKYIIFANGNIYTAKCIAFNQEYDLSLLRMNFDSLINISENKEERLDIGSAVFADNIPELKCDLFCIGNPSNINLESNVDQDNDFVPKIFHLSFGKLEMENNTNKELGAYGHSCWTYWGHSGAPIFNEYGCIVALHNSWNDETGLRHAVKLKDITAFVNIHCKVLE